MKKIDEFEKWLTLNYEREATRKVYLDRMDAYFKKQDVFDQENIDEYLSSLTIGNTTHSLIMASLKIYQKFLTNYTKEIIHIDYPRNRTHKSSDPRYITEDKLHEILTELPIIFQESDKAKATIGLMFYTGMRPKELLFLARKDIDLKNYTIDLFKDNTKTHKDRIAPFSKDLLEYINSYFERTDEDENAFNISDRYLGYICSSIKRNFDIKHFCPYMLRHSFARCFLKRTNYDYDALQILMGHSSIVTTHLYTKKDNKEAIDVYNKAFNKPTKKGRKK